MTHAFQTPAPGAHEPSTHRSSRKGTWSRQPDPPLPGPTNLAPTWKVGSRTWARQTKVSQTEPRPWGSRPGPGETRPIRVPALVLTNTAPFLQVDPKTADRRPEPCQIPGSLGSGLQHPPCRCAKRSVPSNPSPTKFPTPGAHKPLRQTPGPRPVGPMLPDSLIPKAHETGTTLANGPRDQDQSPTGSSSPLIHELSTHFTGRPKNLGVRVPLNLPTPRAHKPGSPFAAGPQDPDQVT